PNTYLRTQSKRLLVERGPRVLSDLASWTRRQTTEPQLLEALWMYQALDRVEPKLLEGLLQAKDSRVRAAAVRVLAGWETREAADPTARDAAWRGWPPAPLPTPREEIPVSRALSLLAAAVADEHPRVRLEALRALARLPNSRAAELALTVADRPMDSHL